MNTVQLLWVLINHRSNEIIPYWDERSLKLRSGAEGAMSSLLELIIPSTYWLGSVAATYPSRIREARVRSPVWPFFSLQTQPAALMRALAPSYWGSWARSV